MTRLAFLLAALASAVVAAATVAWLVKVAANYGKVSRRAYVGSLAAPYCEPDDGVQPPDPRPVTLASGSLEPVDATHWTVTAAGHESQTRVGDRG